MIRAMEAGDVARVGSIWLEASLQAHDFVPASFWLSDHKVMVEEILPEASGFVYITRGTIEGFITVRDSAIGCL